MPQCDPSGRDRAMKPDLHPFIDRAYCRERAKCTIEHLAQPARPCHLAMPSMFMMKLIMPTCLMPLSPIENSRGVILRP